MPWHGIIAGQSGESSINREVLMFLGVDYAFRLGPELIGLHPLDLYRRSLLSNLHRDKRKAPYPISSVVGGAQSLLALPRSAQRLWEAGVRLRPSSGFLARRRGIRRRQAQAGDARGGAARVHL